MSRTGPGAAIYAAAPGEQLGVWCLAQGHLSRGIEGEESAVYSLPHLQFLPARDSNSQPFDYESDSLPLGHDFYETLVCYFVETCFHGWDGGGGGKLINKENCNI